MLCLPRNSRSGWDILIGCADGTLESVSIRFILFVCCNPNKLITAPHVGQIGRSTTRSGKEIVLKGTTGDLVCRSHADQGCCQQRRRQLPGVRFQRPAQGKTRKALIVPWAQSKGAYCGSSCPASSAGFRRRVFLA